MEGVTSGLVVDALRPLAATLRGRGGAARLPTRS